MYKTPAACVPWSGESAILEEGLRHQDGWTDTQTDQPPQAIQMYSENGQPLSSSGNSEETR